MIKNQYIDGEFIVYEYENGAIVKIIQTEETEGQIIELPKNPLIELKEENTQLKDRVFSLENTILLMQGVI